MAAKIKGLQQWCQKMTEGYDRVNIANFTTAWRDGLAFCAIIHRFRPDLIDFDSLSPENVFENCKLAFETAEQELRIPAFLEAEDMVRLKVPDKLSIITYVSQYYNFLHSLPQLGGPGVKKISSKTAVGTKRSTDSDTLQAPDAKKAMAMETKENAAPVSERPATRGDNCAICQKHVYLLERHMEGGKLYHRSCFRHSELSPANKVYTRSPFLSPSLASDALSNDNKPSALLGGGRDNVKRQAENVVVKAVPDASIISKKSENMGYKHHLDDKTREDSKKSRMEPRTLFGVDILKKPVNKDDSTVNKIHSIATNETLKHENKYETRLSSEKESDRQLKGTKLNKPLIFEQKDKPASEANKNDVTVLTSTTPSAKEIAKSKEGQAKSSVNVTTAIVSNTALIKKSDPDIIQHKKLPDSKFADNKTPAEVSSNSVQNLQKMFSGNSDQESGEPAVPGYPVARPRTASLKTAGEVSSKDIVTARSTFVISVGERNANVIPKPTTRQSVVDILEPVAHKSINDSGNSTRHTPPSAISKTILPPPLPTSAPPPLPLSAPSGEIRHGKNDRNAKLHSAKTTLQESRSTINSLELTENTSQSLTTNLSKTPVQDISKIKPADTGSNTNMKHKITSSTAAAFETKSTNKMSDQKLQKENVNIGAEKSSGVVLSGLITSLAGIRSQTFSTSESNNHVSLTPNISKPSLDLKGKGETNFTSAMKTPVNKTTEVASTPIAVPDRTLPQTKTNYISKSAKDSTNTVVNTTRFQSKSDADAKKTVLAQVKKDTAVTNIAITCLASAQSFNKFQDTLSAFSTIKPASSTTTVSSTKESMSAGSKQTKMDNGLSIPVSSEHEGTNKVLTASRAPSQNTNQNRYAVSVNGNQANLSDDKRKSESKYSKSDSKYNSIHTADTVHGISNSDSMASVKNKAVSSSKEDLLDITNIKLKRVMPEKKDTEKEINSAATMYNIPLKKVDVIKGDTKWDSAPDKPQSDNRMVNKSSTSIASESDSSIKPARQQQWKKDAEEKKNKLKENKTLFESGPGLSNQTKGKFDVEISILKPASNEKSSLVSKGAFSEPKVSNSATLLDKVTVKDTKLPLTTKGILSTKKESLGNDKKLDWQIEAEKRMAAVENFDKGITRKLNVAASSNDVIPQLTKNTVFQKSDLPDDIKTQKINLDNYSKDSITSKELKLVVNNTHLKKVERDVKPSLEIEIQKPLVGNDNTNDFREVLHHLKHVTIAEYEKTDLLTTDDASDLQRHTTTDDVPSSTVTKSFLINVNKNNNNKHTAPEHVKQVDDSEHKAGKKDSRMENYSMKVHDEKPFMGLESKTREKDNKAVCASPKGKKKISLLDDNNKPASKSVPASPTNKKKIQVTAKFDFEKSQEFDKGLSASTVNLSIQDKHTPAARQDQEMRSPNHISALELQQQLLNIDARLTELELRGRDLEETIRKVNSLEEDDDNLMIEWFSLVNEKNDLVRKEAELIYQSRGQELESEQDQIESQLRYLINKPDECKSPEEKQEEDYLIKRKVQLVEERNLIIDSMDEDRLRYEDEDKNIEETLKDKGYWKDSTGTLKAIKGKKVANSTFFA